MVTDEPKKWLVPKRRWLLLVAIIAIAVVSGYFLRGRAIEQFLFGLPEIDRFFVNHRPSWPIEAAHGSALVIWAAYTAFFIVLSYSAVARLFFGRKRDVKSIFIGFLALVVWAPWLFLEAIFHEAPQPITDLSDMSACPFDTRTTDRVVVYYYEAPDGKITLLRNGYGGSYYGQKLRPATVEICQKATTQKKRADEEAHRAAEAVRLLREREEETRRLSELNRQRELELKRKEADRATEEQRIARERAERTRLEIERREREKQEQIRREVEEREHVIFEREQRQRDREAAIRTAVEREQRARLDEQQQCISRKQRASRQCSNLACVYEAERGFNC